MKRLGQFATLRLVSAFLPMFALPVVARSSSTNDWAALGLGQSVGTMSAVFIAMGWPLTGPPRVAGQELATSARVYGESWRSSVAAACVAAPVAAAIAAAFVPPDSQLLAAMMALAVSVVGLSPVWHIAASGQAVDLAIYDVLPRLAATAASVVAIVQTGGRATWFYPAALLAAGALASVAYAQKHRRMTPGRGTPLSTLFVRQVTPVATGLVGASYAALTPLLIAAVASVDEVAAYSSAFRLYLVMLTAIMIVNHATLQWAKAGVGASPPQLRITWYLYLAVATGGLVFLATVGPWVGRILFSSAHAFSLQTSAFLGVAFAVLALHSFLNTHFLLPFGLNRAGLHAAALGAAVGIPSTVVFSVRFGADGGAAGVALGETMVAAYLLIIARRRRV